MATFVRPPESWGALRAYTEEWKAFTTQPDVVDIEMIPCSPDFLENQKLLHEKDKKIFGKSTMWCLDWSKTEVYGDTGRANGKNLHIEYKIYDREERIKEFEAKGMSYTEDDLPPSAQEM